MTYKFAIQCLKSDNCMAHPGLRVEGKRVGRSGKEFYEFFFSPTVK